MTRPNPTKLVNTLQQVALANRLGQLKRDQAAKIVAKAVNAK